MTLRARRVMIADVRGRPVLSLCAALAAAALSCGGADVPASCPRDLPMACPTPMPSYSGQVQAIFAAKCVTCHAPGGQESSKPFTTFKEILLEPLSTMLSQVYNCVMPLATAPQLTDDERAALLGWLVCREPDN